MEPLPPTPAHIDSDLFCQFRSPRRGTGNPEVVTNPVWLWMIETGHSGYIANDMFGGPSSLDVGPCWCFDRFGRTETVLPDGRAIFIGGEHEDHYDPDFYIYNDVVVRHATGRTEIFGYSEDTFPPTDFHTATLVGDRIIVIGSLSYPDFRQDRVQVLSFDTTRYQFQRPAATGSSPPWLYKHGSALVKEGSAILVSGGLINGPWPSLVENIDDWQLDLGTWRWERLTNRAWPQFAFVRSDQKSHHLFSLRHQRWEQQVGWAPRADDPTENSLRDLGSEPRLDLIDTLYAPDVPHLAMRNVEDEYNTHRIRVEGITVRYVEDYRHVRMIVEGDLPAETVERLRADLLEKLATIETISFDCARLEVD